MPALACMSCQDSARGLDLISFYYAGKLNQEQDNMNRNLMYQVEFEPTNPKEEVLSLPCLTTSLLVPNSSLIDENEWGI